MPNTPPSVAELKNAIKSVTTLTNAVEALTIEVGKQTSLSAKQLLFRRRVTIAMVVLVVGSVVAGGLIIRHQVRLANRHAEEVAKRAQFAACQSVNVSNKAILDLLDTATAAQPTEPPVDSSPGEASAFRLQQERSKIFVENTHKRLAPKRC